jgi:eukaryotic-like serine/threonine-protein kinase
MLDPGTRGDIWIIPASGDRQPVAILQTPANEGAAQLSPDGHWLVYESDETGPLEVHIRSIVLAGRSQQISAGGGTRPRWRADGREIFYLAADGQLMAVDVALDDEGRRVEVGTPTSLFATRLAYGTNTGMPLPNYAVMPDGQRFLMNALAPESETTPITVVLNWQARLKD